MRLARTGSLPYERCGPTSDTAGPDQGQDPVGHLGGQGDQDAGADHAHGGDDSVEHALQVGIWSRRYERLLATRRAQARTVFRSPSSRKYATTPNARIAQPAAGTARATASSL